MKLNSFGAVDPPVSSGGRVSSLSFCFSLSLTSVSAPTEEPEVRGYTPIWYHICCPVQHVLLCQALMYRFRCQLDSMVRCFQKVELKFAVKHGT